MKYILFTSQLLSSPWGGSVRLSGFRTGHVNRETHPSAVFESYLSVPRSGWCLYQAHRVPRWDLRSSYFGKEFGSRLSKPTKWLCNQGNGFVIFDPREVRILSCSWVSLLLHHGDSSIFLYSILNSAYSHVSNKYSFSYSTKYSLKYSSWKTYTHNLYSLVYSVYTLFNSYTRV